MLDVDDVFDDATVTAPDVHVAGLTPRGAMGELDVEGTVEPAPAPRGPGRALLTTVATVAVVGVVATAVVCVIVYEHSCMSV